MKNNTAININLNLLFFVRNKILAFKQVFPYNREWQGLRFFKEIEIERKIYITRLYKNDNDKREI